MNNLIDNWSCWWIIDVQLRWLFNDKWYCLLMVFIEIQYYRVLTCNFYKMKNFFHERFVWSQQNYLVLWEKFGKKKKKHLSEFKWSEALVALNNSLWWQKKHWFTEKEMLLISKQALLLNKMWLFCLKGDMVFE